MQLKDILLFSLWDIFDRRPKAPKRAKNKEVKEGKLLKVSDSYDQNGRKIVGWKSKIFITL